ncbi:MAG: hypothetical protein K9J46_22465 [Saprospiraceae bacterium]|nr:hypothetical protein [Saprospiraceae bacterium]MCF8314254.1 hypothetical protein [Saprospiraceae bacterium]MCF8443070.1 hypothetical protein [Saprospiraceae bacterium]
MEIIVETGILPIERVESLLKEGNEILAVVVSARKNTPSKTNPHFQKK